MPNRAVNIAPVITGTQALVLDENPQRTYCLLENDGAVDIYLGLGTPAAVNRGIRVNNGGGSFEITKINPWHGKIYAVSAGTVRLLINEY